MKMNYVVEPHEPLNTISRSKRLYDLVQTLTVPQRKQLAESGLVDEGTKNILLETVNNNKNFEKRCFSHTINVFGWSLFLINFYCKELVDNGHEVLFLTTTRRESHWLKHCIEIKLDRPIGKGTMFFAFENHPFFIDRLKDTIAGRKVKYVLVDEGVSSRDFHIATDFLDAKSTNYFLVNNTLL